MTEILPILERLQGFTDIGILIIVAGFLYYKHMQGKVKEVENKPELTALKIISTDLKSLEDKISEINKSVNNKRSDEPTIREDVRNISSQMHIIDKKLDSNIGVIMEKFASYEVRFKQIEERLLSKRA